MAGRVTSGEVGGRRRSVVVGGEGRAAVESVVTTVCGDMGLGEEPHRCDLSAAGVAPRLGVLPTMARTDASAWRGSRWRSEDDDELIGRPSRS